jgi:hypothetical protein
MYSAQASFNQIAVSGMRSTHSTGRNHSCAGFELPTPISSRAVTTAISQGSPKGGTLRKEGEYWTVGYGENLFCLKDRKGLALLASLLRNPGVEFHALDLAGGIASRPYGYAADQAAARLARDGNGLDAGIHVTNLGDAGEMLDQQAKSAYRRRLSELREELEEAKERAHIERAERAEQEIDALTR